MIRKTIFILSLILATSVTWAQANAAGETRFVDVIVSLNVDPATQPAAANRAFAREVARGYGVEARHAYGKVFSGFAARIPEGRLNALRNDPLVESVQIDQPIWAFQSCKNPRKPCDEPPPDDGGGGGDTGGSSQVIPWGISRIGADINTNSGAGVDVYIIDSGIDSDHPDLNVATGFASENCKGKTCNVAWDDDDGHGTHVAGTVAALDNNIQVVGVAPGATLHAVKVLNNRGSGSFSGIIAGIDWVAGQVAASGRPAVANMSLGGSGSKTGSCNNGQFSGSDNFHRALCAASAAGVVFVVAAGNSGADAATAVPAAFDDTVITVSATSEGDNWPSWSNWGVPPVAIAAPGVNILSSWNNGSTNTISGTSMASPHAAGAAALVLASGNAGSGFSAFVNTRQALLNASEPTASFSNTSGNPHPEPFLNARGL
ncbi:MAG: S8 family serine peptidase [Wenzhouxiangellaceae bacterium]|nr:S8 family serine peptidase [Wenzhouxiangellaceae bacterium]